MSEPSTAAPPVVVTGANGLVGARVGTALVARGATVRGVVRRAGTAPSGVEEWVGEFHDPGFAATVVQGASAVVTTVHPMGSDEATQRRIGVGGTTALARAARDAGVPLFVHVSTTSVYDRRPHVGDVGEGSALVGDGAGAYSVTKRDTDAALAGVDGMTRVLVRPPVILGPGASSMWNTLRPAQIRNDASAAAVNPQETFPWVHVADLAALIADVAAGLTAASDDPERGPVKGACTVVNAAAGSATARDYYGTVTRALGVDPRWQDAPAWTGRIVAHRARSWGWAPTVDLAAALAELEVGLRA